MYQKYLGQLVDRQLTAWCPGLELGAEVLERASQPWPLVQFITVQDDETGQGTHQQVVPGVFEPAITAEQQRLRVTCVLTTHNVVNTGRKEHEIARYQFMRGTIDRDLAMPAPDEMEHRAFLARVGQLPGRHQEIAEVHAAGRSQSFEDVGQDFHIRFDVSLM